MPGGRNKTGELGGMRRPSEFSAFIQDPISRLDGKAPRLRFPIDLQNTVIFFEKYSLDLILFENHSAHTSNIKIMFPPKNLNPP
jgi:hypothetical protein